MQAWIEAVPLGVHHAPQGQLNATADWVDRRVRQVNRMRELGIQLPVCWGHQKAAMPGEAGDEAFRKYAASRYNAGYILGARKSPKTGALSVQVDVPGATVDKDGRLLSNVTLENGATVQTAIGEVSAKVVPQWRDGKGRTWKNPLAHLALVPLPVVMNQKGFAELGTDAAEDGAVYLGSSSLIELSTGSTMPFPIKKKPDGEPADDDDSLDDVDEPAADDAPAATPPSTPPAAPASMDANFSAVITGLSKKGIHLAPGTTPENLVERLHIALHQCNEGDGDDDVDDDPGEAVEGGGGQPVEEQRPIMMSTLEDADPAFRRMFEEKQHAYRAKMLKRIDRMAKADGDVPFLPQGKAAEFRSAFGGYELSTTADGDPIEQKADIELSAWWDAYQQSTQAKQRYVGKGQRQKRPDEAGRDAEGHVTEEEIDARAARVSAR